MAEGFDLTTYYAKRIIGDTAAVDAEKALLQTGDGITTDTWILHRTNRTNKLYGIKYKYDSSNHDKIEYYGKTSSDNATAWIQLDTGDASFIGNVTANKFIGPLQGNADTASAANITTTANTLAYYSNTTGAFADTGIKYFSGTANAGKTYIGWVKFASIDIGTNNYWGDKIYDIFLDRGYSSPQSEVYSIRVSVGWGASHIIQLSGRAGSQIMNKFRIVRDHTNHIAYFEYYVNTSYTTHQNTVNIKILGYHGAAVTLMNTVQTEEDSEFNYKEEISLVSNSIVGNLTGNASTATNVAWSGVQNPPAQATRWAKWNEIGAGADSLTEGTSNWTDNTEILTSYASNNGFADTNAKGIVYRRDAICAYNYIKGKASGDWAINANSATKLQTARSLWGNSFDGTADISDNIYVSKAGETYVRATNTTTSCSIELNSYTDKQGLWSNGYWNGSAYTAASKWLIYRGTDGNVIVNGNITGNAVTATKAMNLNCPRVTKSANEHPGKNITSMQEFSSTSANLPSSHFYYILEAQGDDPAYSVQLAMGETASAIYYRAIQNNTYNDWNRLVTNSGSWSISVTGSSGSCTGNAATATSATYLKDRTNSTASYLNYGAASLAASAITWLCCWNGYEVRAISKVEMANAVDSAHKWVRIGGDTMTGLLKITTNSNTLTIGSQSTGFCHITNTAAIPFWFNQDIQMEKGKIIGGAGTQFRPYQIYLGRNTTSDSKALNSANPLIEFSNSDRSQYAQLVYTDFNNQGGSDSLTFVSNQNDLRIYAPKVHNAVWNDYAETRATDITEPGRVVTENGKSMKIADERLLPGCRIISDTYGTCMGREEDTPIAVSGRVLVYPYRNCNDYPLGAAVCSAPNGTVDIMTREEIINYPERIIGTVSEIPDYEYWGAGQDGKLQIAVNNRIWIYVR